VRVIRAALLAAALLAVPVPAAAQPAREVFVVTTEDISFPAALRHPVIGGVARAGGIGLLAGDRFRHPVRLDPGPVGNTQLAELESSLAASGADQAMVIVAGSVEDRPDWLALAIGPPDELLEATGSPGGLTSETTGRDGIVGGVDAVPTVLGFLAPGPGGYAAYAAESAGSPIRVEGEAPSDLYERAVEYLRVALPVGLGVLALGIGSLVVGVGVLLIGIVSPVVRTAVAVLGLLSVALLVAMIPASVLPSLEPAVVIPSLLLLGGLLLMVALVAGRGDAARSVTVVAAAGLVILVVDGILGWPTELTPLLGGGALLGVRFTGLGNSAAGIVLAGSVLWAARLSPWAGVALLAGAALFAGLPFLGVDLGGGVSLFGATGLWYGWRVRGRFDAAAVGFAVAAAVAGALLLVGFHALWPEPSHVARAVESGGLVGTFLDRLASNVRATTEIWPVWLTVLGLPAWLLVAARRWGPFREPLARWPWWRAGVIVLAIGGMIGYVVNDTFGMAAIAFVFCSAAMVYPALRERWISA
jgi:hypothetical protein